ncbi:hypothetical protein K438DRAFT_1937847 [Mycena galopus ATCC 62051]|nr:hypothetical protein K438DRAFT_1937847 [Mycena galopus ATCC 62051]
MTDTGDARRELPHNLSVRAGTAGGGPHDGAMVVPFTANAFFSRDPVDVFGDGRIDRRVGVNGVAVVVYPPTGSEHWRRSDGKGKDKAGWTRGHSVVWSSATAIDPEVFVILTRTRAVKYNFGVQRGGGRPRRCVWLDALEDWCALKEEPDVLVSRRPQRARRGKRQYSTSSHRAKDVGHVKRGIALVQAVVCQRSRRTAGVTLKKYNPGGRVE